MSQIEIVTSQNTTINYNLASLQKRTKALAIDWLIKITYGLLFIVILSSFEEETSFTIILLGLILPTLFYSLVLEIALNGQTIGKIVQKIQVSKLDGTQPSLGDYLLRWLMCIVEFTAVPGLCLIVYLFNNKGQRIGDILAGTTVINKDQEYTIEDTLLHVSDIPANYAPTFPSVTKFTNKDMEIIKKALNQYISTSDEKVLEALIKKVKQVAELEETKKITTADLDIMIKDFNYYQQKES